MLYDDKRNHTRAAKTTHGDQNAPKTTWKTSSNSDLPLIRAKGTLFSTPHKTNPTQHQLRKIATHHSDMGAPSMADRTPTTRSSTTAPGIRCLIWLRPLPEEQGRTGNALGVALFVVLPDATQAKEAFRLILPVLQYGTLRRVVPTDLTKHGGCSTLDTRLFDPRPAMFCDGRPSDPGCFAHVAGALVRGNESTRGDLRISTASSTEVALVPLRSQFRFRTFLWPND